MFDSTTNDNKRLDYFDHHHQLNQKKQVKFKTCADVYDYWRNCKRLYKKAPKDGVEFQVEYIDTGLALDDELRAKAPIALALHGAPGSYHDFTLLIRHLSRQNVRVIAPNFPEYIATVKTKVLFRHSADEKAAYLRDFLKAINVNKIDLLVSHSSAIFPTLLILLNANNQAIARQQQARENLDHQNNHHHHNDNDEDNDKNNKKKKKKQTKSESKKQQQLDRDEDKHDNNREMILLSSSMKDISLKAEQEKITPPSTRNDDPLNTLKLLDTKRTIGGRHTIKIISDGKAADGAENDKDNDNIDGDDDEDYEEEDDDDDTAEITDDDDDDLDENYDNDEDENETFEDAKDEINNNNTQSNETIKIEDKIVLDGSQDNGNCCLDKKTTNPNVEEQQHQLSDTLEDDINNEKKKKGKSKGKIMRMKKMKGKGGNRKRKREDVIVKFDQPIEIKAVALLNPAGHRMPKSMKPTWFKCGSCRIYQHKLGRSLFRKLGPAFLTVVGVPVRVDNMDNVMLSATVMRNSKCHRVVRQLQQLSEMELPTLLVFSENDKLIEREIFYEMTQFMKLEQKNFDIFNNDGDIELSQSSQKDWIRVMVFKAGGHYAYSNYANTVNKAVSELLNKVVKDPSRVEASIESC